LQPTLQIASRKLNVLIHFWYLKWQSFK